MVCPAHIIITPQIANKLVMSVVSLETVEVVLAAAVVLAVPVAAAVPVPVVDVAFSEFKLKLDDCVEVVPVTAAVALPVVDAFDWI